MLGLNTWAYLIDDPLGAFRDSHRRSFQPIELRATIPHVCLDKPTHTPSQQPGHLQLTRTHTQDQLEMQ